MSSPVCVFVSVSVCFSVSNVWFYQCRCPLTQACRLFRAWNAALILQQVACCKIQSSSRGSSLFWVKTCSLDLPWIHKITQNSPTTHLICYKKYFNVLTPNKEESTKTCINLFIMSAKASTFPFYTLLCFVFTSASASSSYFPSEVQFTLNTVAHPM